MSIDAEITNINKAIASVHFVLYKFSSQLNETLNRLHGILNNFDKEVDNAVGKVNEVGEEVVRATKKFPSDIVYHVIILMFIFVLTLLCLYMIHYIYKWISERKFAYNREVRCYKEKMYTMIDEERPANNLVNIDTSPIIYHEYLNAKDCI
ncbi:hypothetical protein KIN20_004916 [Parelaphostrongylus tenuis]|uniref:Uncharacterized protein n=1 Tax=Parelaphostrongylus tenuis TaxID=148309 RepID=A0AAD5QJN8_PARTN|nr:hypothetical protein KIN20_004916 [Parelaphostrongylus tenuis]